MCGTHNNGDGTSDGDLPLDRARGWRASKRSPSLCHAVNRSLHGDHMHVVDEQESG